QVEHRGGDSSMEVAGYASVGSRSAMTVSHALIKTIEAILAKGRTIAATVLEAADADIEYLQGRFTRRGPPPHRRPVRACRGRSRFEEARRNRRGPRHQGECGDAAHLPQRL